MTIEMDDWQLVPMTTLREPLALYASRETLNVTLHAGHGRAYYLRNPREQSTCCYRHAPRPSLFARLLARFRIV